MLRAGRARYLLDYDKSVATVSANTSSNPPFSISVRRIPVSFVNSKKAPNHEELFQKIEARISASALH